MATTAAMQLQLLPNNGLSSFCGSKSCAPRITSVHLPPAHLLPAGRRGPCYMASPSPSMVSQLELSSVGRNLNLGLQRKAVRLGLPSKGRMAEGTLALLKECQLSVRKPNPRQYVADIPELKNLEVWFQREADVVRKILSGDVDLGIVGYDVVVEHGEENEDLLVLHDALGFGECYLALGIPTYGIFGDITSVEELAAMPQWTADRPLRIVTGFTNLGQRFLQEKGFKHVKLSTADGALEAAPAMGTADAILDLVSSGTTLRENNLKEIEGGKVMSSQGVLIASRKALLERPGALEAVHEMLERLDAHLRARDQFLVTANMRGDSAEDVASRVLKSSQVSGLQGPTVSPVYSQENSLKVNYFAVSICVNKKDLYSSVKKLRGMSGSGVLVAPLTYIFEEESPRWRALLEKLNK